MTKNSAVLSGTIRYVGIVPEYVDARLGTSRNNQLDIVKVRFIDNGNKTMNLERTLTSLEPCTTYYVCVFMKPGGFDYVSEDIEFTTAGTASEPEPTPEPNKSELRIIPNKYPTGELKEGSSFRLSGRIKPNCHITDVRSYILDSNHNVLQESSGWTATQTYVIEGSALDKGMKFNNLSEGGYSISAEVNGDVEITSYDRNGVPTTRTYGKTAKRQFKRFKIQICPIKEMYLIAEYINLDDAAVIMCSSYPIDTEKVSFIKNKLCLEFDDTTMTNSPRAFNIDIALRIKEFIEKMLLLCMCVVIVVNQEVRH